MAYLIAQGGSSLYKIDLTTGTATTLTLPTGVTLSTTRKPKFAVLNEFVVMVNSPSRNLAIDAEGNVRVLVPIPPTHGPDISAGSGTGLTGEYKSWVSFIVKDADGNVLAESPLSDYYRAVTVDDDDIQYNDVPLSPDGAWRRVYRSLTGGDIPYHLLDLNDNTTQSFNNNTTDAVLELLPTQAVDLKSPPGTVPGIRLKNIIEWKSCLFAIADEPSLVDQVYITETNKIYAWTRTLIAHPSGADAKGLIGFAARQNVLGLIKRNGVWKIASSSDSTGINIEQTNVGFIGPEGGSLSPETIVSEGDWAMWLGNDGVYEWSDNGVVNVSRDQVHPWFTTDTYFNRTRFPNAWAEYNKTRDCYRLHLAAAGSSVEDRWVDFNRTNRRWYGPHKTGLFTPSHGANLIDENGLPVCVVGGTDGVIYTMNSTTIRDGASTAIDMDVFGPIHHGDDPDGFHFWGELSVNVKVQGSGDLTITPALGSDADTFTNGSAITHTMTTGRRLHRRIGHGRLVKFRFQQATVNVSAAIRGYELPYYRVARR